MRRHKYNAKRTECNQGHSHPSRREAMRCNDLTILSATGQIAKLEVEPTYYFTINGRQIKHDNGRRIGYRPDFAYIENGQQVCEDVKSKATMTEAATLRIAIFKALYPDIEVRLLMK